MSVPRISLRYNSLIALFLVSLFVHFRRSQGQTTTTADYNCSTIGQSCVSYYNCPNATQIIQSGNGKKCGFTYEKGKQVVKICCNIATFSTPTTTKATTPTTTKAIASTTIRTKLQVQSTPAIRVKLTSTSRNATAVALEKCREYGKYRYVKTWKSPQLPGEDGYYFNKQDCINVHTLIAGGSPAVEKEYPHMALIGYGNKFTDVQWGCGGSLISERFVLSAAHCGKNSELGPPRWALLGDLTLSKKTDSRPVTYSIINIYDHPQYQKPSFYYDISLFELNTTVQMNPWVRPACLHTSLTDLTEGLKTSITGWGKTDTIARNPINDNLLKASISIVKDRLCKISFNSEGNTKLIRGYDSNSMICAGDLKDGNDTCQGDSGGPQQILIPTEVCMWNIIGVTSFGPSVCGNGEDPGVYTRVAYYISWIQSIVWP